MKILLSGTFLSLGLVFSSNIYMVRQNYSSSHRLYHMQRTGIIAIFPFLTIFKNPEIFLFSQSFSILLSSYQTREFLIYVDFPFKRYFHFSYFGFRKIEGEKIPEAFNIFKRALLHHPPSLSHPDIPGIPPLIKPPFRCCRFLVSRADEQIYMSVHA